MSSGSPSALVKISHWRSVTTPMKMRTPSFESKMSYTPHARLPADMGSGSLPLTTCCIMCVETSHAAFSKRPLCTYWPLPVRSRSRNAARIAMAPNMPPIMSLTGAPARSGLPTGPVMYASPLIICTTSSSAVRFS